MKTADFNALRFCFLIKKNNNERGDQIFWPFFLVVSAFFYKYAQSLLKRNVNPTINVKYRELVSKQLIIAPRWRINKRDGRTKTNLYKNIITKFLFYLDHFGDHIPTAKYNILVYLKK